MKIAVLFLLGCAGASPKAEFAEDIAVCELRATCAAAVQCRKDAALKHGRDPQKTVGTCEPK